MSRQRKYIAPGERFGLLTVVAVYEPGITRKSGIGRKPAILTAHVCKCDCGNEAIALATELRAGRRSSCGCRKSWTARGRLAPGMHSSTRYLSDKDRYRRNGQTFALTKEQWESVRDAPCTYCGSTKDVHVGRINTKLPAREGNIEPRCPTCGKAKGRLTSEEFRLWLRRVFAYLGGQP